MSQLKKYHFTLQNLTLGLRNFFYVKILRQIRCRHHWYTVYQKEINPGVLLLCKSFCLNDIYAELVRCWYTQYHLIRTTVNFLLVIVLIFSQNFTSNGPYVVLNFCEFSGTMVLIFWKMSCFLSKELESVLFFGKNK